MNGGLPNRLLMGRPFAFSNGGHTGEAAKFGSDSSVATVAPSRTSYNRDMPLSPQPTPMSRMPVSSSGAMLRTGPLEFRTSYTSVPASIGTPQEIRPKQPPSQARRPSSPKTFVSIQFGLP